MAGGLRCCWQRCKRWCYRSVAAKDCHAARCRKGRGEGRARRCCWCRRSERSAPPTKASEPRRSEVGSGSVLVGTEPAPVTVSMPVLVLVPVRVSVAVSIYATGQGREARAVGSVCGSKDGLLDTAAPPVRTRRICRTGGYGGTPRATERERESENTHTETQGGAETQRARCCERP